MTSNHTVMRRMFGVVAALALAASAMPAVAQADYPNKPVRMLIGFPPGQATDTLGRAIAQKLSQQLGQQFVVENKPGAAGIIATQAAMSSPADGYTLLVSSSGPLAVNPGLYSKLPYDPIKDFTPVAGIAIVPLILVVNPNFPANNLKELVAMAKAKPKDVNYASGGSGVTNHLVMEMFRGASGIDITHIPYKGGPPAVTDLIGGQVNVMFETSVAVLPFVKQGKLRALAVSSAKAHQQRTGYPDRRRARLSGLQRRALGRNHGSCQHAGADRGKAQCGSEQGTEHQRDSRPVRGPRGRADGDEP